MKNATVKRLVGVFTICFMLPSAAFAHTGGIDTTSFMSGFSHPLGGMDHFLAMLAVGLWASQLSNRAIWLVPSAFVVLMLVGGGLGFAGVALPYIETAIIVSLLVLGLIVAGAFKLPLTASALLVGFFALFHGHAHGTEMALELGAVFYSLGFAFATACLHAVGLFTGWMLQKRHLPKLTQALGGFVALSGVVLAFA